MDTTNRKNFYDMSQIRDIPIQDVCRYLGIPIIPKGGKLWCKLRDERTASTILHPESNTFHDFGTNQHGDAVDIVCAVNGVSKAEAIRFLAEAFHISPETPAQHSGQLSDWEYRQIGIAGDLATKNFSFDIERQGTQRVMQLSQRYGIPMNDLRRNHPRVYAQVLRQKAIPFVTGLRNTYYLDVFSQYSLAKSIGAAQAFSSEQVRAEFVQEIEQLQRAESILLRACQHTSIQPRPVGSYEPESDLAKILSGDIKISLSEKSSWDMNRIAKARKTAVKYRTVDVGQYLSGKLDSFTHSAFLKKDTVVVGYLETDYRQIKAALDTMVPRGNERQQSPGSTLDDLAAGARKQISQQKAAPQVPVKAPDIGMDR